MDPLLAAVLVLLLLVIVLTGGIVLLIRGSGQRTKLMETRRIGELASLVKALNAEREKELAVLASAKDKEISVHAAKKELMIASLQADREKEVAAVNAEKEKTLAAVKAEKEKEIAAVMAGKEKALAVLRLEKDSEMATAARRIRKDASDRSRAVLKGKIGEQMAPLLEEFHRKYELSDARFIGDPVDYIIFRNLTRYKDEMRRKVPPEDRTNIEVVISDIKTGRARLSPEQREIRDAVENRRVRWDEIRMVIPDGRDRDVDMGGKVGEVEGEVDWEGDEVGDVGRVEQLTLVESLLEKPSRAEDEHPE